MKTDEKFDLVIEGNKHQGNYIKDLWLYRGLFYFLAWRDLLVRYKQTVIGISWSIIRPLLTLIVFTFIFGHISRLPAHGIPYALLVCAGIIPWQFFANSFTEASNSLITNSNLLSKVYFPRLILPASTILVSLIDFLFSLVILTGLMIYYRFIPGPQIFLLPFFLILGIITSLGCGILIAALNVKYRDFKYIVPFIVQLGLFISPVGFSSSVVPERYRLLYSLNPMVGVIDGFRWCLINDNVEFYLPGFILSVLLSILILVLSLKYFRSIEKSIADLI